MKKNFLLIAMIAAIGLSGCAGEVQYRDKFAIMTPNDNLLQDTPVPPPPATSVEYSKLSCDGKEDMLTQYIDDLLGVIGKDRADKAGLRTWKADAAAQVDKLNKKAQDNGSASN